MLEIVFTHFVWYPKIEFRPVYGESERLNSSSKHLGLYTENYVEMACNQRIPQDLPRMRFIEK